MECDVPMGHWQWLACLCSPGVIFPVVATVFPTIVSNSSVLCFIVWIAPSCMSFSTSLPFPEGWSY